MKKIGKFLDTVLKTWWIRHLLFWIFIWNYYTWGVGFDPGKMREEYIHIAKFIPGMMMLVYSLLYYLIPKFLMQKKYVEFFAGFVVLGLVIIAYAEIFKLNYHGKKPFVGFDIKWGKNILPFFHVCALATSIKFIKYSYFEEDRELKAKQQKTQAELELLKAQIHPHFLFNTLNNLFAHTLRNSPDSSRIVNRLSDLLKFMIYKSREEFIPVTQEIQLLKNYIDLEKIRYGQELDLSANFTGDIKGKMIRPLLLLPLVENSFKHGLSQQLENKWISLEMHVEKNSLFFKLGNSRDKDLKGTFIPGKTKGIGLENVKKRLELLYPGRHSMQVDSSDDMFVVSVDLQIETEIQSKDSDQVVINQTVV